MTGSNTWTTRDTRHVNWTSDNVHVPGSPRYVFTSCRLNVFRPNTAIVFRRLYARHQLQGWLPMRLRLTLVACASCLAAAWGLLR